MSIKIDRNISVSKLIEDYPFLEKILVDEYGFHCASCMFSEFDTLEEGAGIHGIEGQYFDELLTRIEEVITQNQKKSETE